MAINKVVYGNQVLIDITDSTVNPNTLLAGYKAYGANGQPVNGALQLSYHITLHQAQYDALSESEQMADENWFYIDDAESIGAQLDDSAISPAKVWSSQKTNNEIQDVQDQVDINTTDIGTLNSALGHCCFYGDPIVIAVDATTTGIKIYDLTNAETPPATYMGKTRLFTIVQSSTYRVSGMGVGGTRVYYNVGTASTTPVSLTLFPVYG